MFVQDCSQELRAIGEGRLVSQRNHPIEAHGPARNNVYANEVGPGGADLRFRKMKKQLAPISAAANKEEMRRPSLKITREEGREPPAKLEYKPGQPVEMLCSAPARTVNGAAR
jgi:hypothetical protein